MVAIGGQPAIDVSLHPADIVGVHQLLHVLAETVLRQAQMSADDGDLGERHLPGARIAGQVGIDDLGCAGEPLVEHDHAWQQTIARPLEAGEAESQGSPIRVIFLLGKLLGVADDRIGVVGEPAAGTFYLFHQDVAMVPELPHAGIVLVAPNIQPADDLIPGGKD